VRLGGFWVHLRPDRRVRVLDPVAGAQDVDFAEPCDEPGIMPWLDSVVAAGPRQCGEEAIALVEHDDEVPAHGHLSASHRPNLPGGHAPSFPGLRLCPARAGLVTGARGRGPRNRPHMPAQMRLGACRVTVFGLPYPYLSDCHTRTEEDSVNRTPIASRQHVTVARRLASLALATGLTLGLGGTLAACSDQDIDDTADQVKDVSGEARGVVDQARQSIDDAHATFENLDAEARAEAEVAVAEADQAIDDAQAALEQAEQDASAEGQQAVADAEQQVDQATVQLEQAEEAVSGDAAAALDSIGQNLSVLGADLRDAQD
jgi:F0F1-type ATP synthase membrane subunit b/b'